MKVTGKRHAYAKNASKAKGWVVDVVATKWSAKKQRSHDLRGSYGPASEVVHVDPATYDGGSSI